MLIRSLTLALCLLSSAVIAEPAREMTAKINIVAVERNGVISDIGVAFGYGHDVQFIANNSGLDDDIVWQDLGDGRRVGSLNGDVDSLTVGVCASDNCKISK